MELTNSQIGGNNTLVVYIDNGDSGPLVDLLKTHQNGYSIFGDGVDIPFAVVDRRLLEKGYTKDHLLAIEAHELGHILNKTKNEIIAEKEGIKILQNAGLYRAAKILIERGIL